ncbi:hypothetical protein JCM9279_006599 [Rhodotorula babjevae]
MPTSLLSLPDELLTLVVDQAIGDHAPRLYKERQQTARALALVNKRIGAVGGDKLLDVVAFSGGRANGIMSHRAMHAALRSPRHVRALYVAGGQVGPPAPSAGLPAPSDPLLGVTVVIADPAELRISWINKLEELRELQLIKVAVVPDAPLECHKLARLSFHGCTLVRSRTVPAALLTTSGCPLLRHLHLAGANLSTFATKYPPVLLGHGVSDQLDSLRFYFEDERRCNIPWPALCPKDPALDRALFVSPLHPWAKGLVMCPAVRHVHVRNDYPAGSPLPRLDLAYITSNLGVLLPDLETLYLPAELAPDPALHGSARDVAFDDFIAACAARRIEVVWVDSAKERFAGAHFEARCRRIKAEQAAAASAAAQTAATSAAARR